MYEQSVMWTDGWTAATRDGKRSAQVPTRTSRLGYSESLDLRSFDSEG